MKAAWEVDVQHNHDDIIKWKHFPRYWSFVRGIHRSPVNSPHKGQWRGALMLSLICAWKQGWVNNREAGDLRHHRAHYDVTVLTYPKTLMDHNVEEQPKSGCTGTSAGWVHIATDVCHFDNPLHLRTALGACQGNIVCLSDDFLTVFVTRITIHACTHPTARPWREYITINFWEL